MKSIRFIDRPVRVPRSFYEDAVSHLIQSNQKIPGLLSIYRFGNVTTPGISDLDILFVFKKGIHCPLNGLESLPDKFAPLFTHGIMAMSEEHFTDNFHYTIWSKAACVWGNQLPEPTQRTTEQTVALSRQTAVEFLLANYIDFSVQSTYRVFKLRSFLQHMKGLAFDMELLGIQDSPIHPLIEQMRALIQNWFEDAPSDHQISVWISSFYEVFPGLLGKILSQYPLVFPEGNHYTIASNMVLSSSNKIGFSHSGLGPIPLLAFLGRNYFKLLHRTNKFQFTCPVRHESQGFLADRFRFLQQMKSYNRKHLPRFMTMTPSINAKIL